MRTNLRPVLLAAGLTTGAVLLLPSTANAEEATPAPETSSKVTDSQAAGASAPTTSTSKAASVPTGAAEAPKKSEPVKTAKEANAEANAAKAVADSAEATAKQTLNEAQDASKDAAKAAADAQATNAELTKAKEQAQAADAAAANVDQDTYKKNLEAEAQAAAPAKAAQQAQAEATQKAAKEQEAKTAAEKQALAAKAEQKAAAEAKPQAQATLDAATKEKTDAVANHDRLLANADAATKKAQAELAEAKKKTAEIADNVKGLANAEIMLTAELVQARNELAKAEAAVRTAKAELEQAKKNEAAAAQAAANAGKPVTDAKTAVAQAEAALKAAKQAVSTANAAIAAANADLAAKKAAVGNAEGAVTAAEQAAKEAAAEYNKGSIGFFEWAKAEDAVKALTSSTSGEYGKRYRDATIPGAAGDATNLETMLQALQAIKYANDLRQAEGLPPFKVNHTLMAIAQVYANWTSSMNRLVHHDLNSETEPFMHANGENLASEGNGLGAVVLWHAEKRIWDRLLKEGKVTEADKVNPFGLFIRDEKTYKQVGHYLNLMLPGDGSATGMGISKVDGHLRVVAGEYALGTHASSAGAQDFDTYANNFWEYYKRVKAAKDQGEAKVKAAKDRVAEAQADVEAAQQRLSDAIKAHQARLNEEAQAKTRVTKAEAALKTAEAGKAKADKAAQAASALREQAAQTVEKKTGDETRASWTVANTDEQLNKVMGERSRRQGWLDDARIAEAEVAKRVDNLLKRHSLKDAMDRVTKAESALTDAQAGVVAADKRLKAADAAVAAAKTAVEQATTKAAAAATAKTEADQQATAAATALAQATAKVAVERKLLTDQQQAHEAVTNAESRLASFQASLQNSLARLIASTGAKSLAQADAAKLSAVASELAAVKHDQALAEGFKLTDYPVLVEVYQFAKVSRETAASLRAAADKLAADEAAKLAAEKRAAKPGTTKVVVDTDGRTHLKVETPYQPRHLAKPAENGRELARTGVDSLDLLPLAGGMVLAGVALRRRKTLA